MSQLELVAVKAPAVSAATGSGFALALLPGRVGDNRPSRRCPTFVGIYFA